MAKRIYKLELVLTEFERAELEKLARRRKTAQALALRARIVLQCAAGKSHLAIAEQLGVSNVTLVSGVDVSSRNVWMACPMSRVLVSLGKSPMRMLNA